MELNQLRSFVAVVKWGNFTRAAEALHVSQPTISAHIRQLEEELHTKLILRTTKNVGVTPKGRELSEYAEMILQLQARIIESCSSENQKIIHIGASTIPSAYILPEMLPAYCAQHPDVYFVVQQNDSQGVITGLLDGVFDVGFIGMHSVEGSLTCVPFYKDRMVIITPVNERFLAMSKEPQPPIKELLKEPFILREKGSGSQKRADTILEHFGLQESDLQVTARLNDQEAIKNLVASGLGISIVSEKAAHNFLLENRILLFEFPELESARTLYLAYRKDFIQRSSTQDFIHFIKQNFRI